MDKMKNNKGTPSKETGSNAVDRDSNTRNSDNPQPEIPLLNPSTITPAIPSEMPAREIR